MPKLGIKGVQEIIFTLLTMIIKIINTKETQVHNYIGKLYRLLRNMRSYFCYFGDDCHIKRLIKYTLNYVIIRDVSV